LPPLPPLPFGTPFVYGDPMSAGDFGVPPVDEIPSIVPAASARCLGLNVSFSRFKDAIGNLDLHVVHIGTGLQKIERHIEQIKPTSMIFLWQKHAARKSTLSSVGTAIRRRKPEGGRKQVNKYCKRA